MMDAFGGTLACHSTMTLMDLIPIAVFGALMLALWLLRNSPYSHSNRNKRRPDSYQSDWQEPM